MAGNKLLVYLLRRDLRAIDNPILHHLATSDHGFTHLLPIYILPPHQIETSGFVPPPPRRPPPQAPPPPPPPHKSFQMFSQPSAKLKNPSVSVLAPLSLALPHNYNDFEQRTSTLDGFKGASGKYDKKWKNALKEKADVDQDPSPEELSEIERKSSRGSFEGHYDWRYGAGYEELAGSDANWANWRR
ncbi:hypothetical protein FOFC_11060 [Fusarium oxysporum]|nr:hypothetical protein FOFC_11060 [Fusarium oxysporum]